jgi:hypothetical protein
MPASAASAKDARAIIIGCICMPESATSTRATTRAPSASA